MYPSENEGNSEARRNAGNSPAVAWDSVRAYGQFMSAELLLDIDYRWAIRCAGAALAKDSRDPFGGEPLTMTLAPDLDPNDESVRYLVKLTMVDAVECLAAPELAQRLDPELGAVAWQTEKRDNLDVAIWRTREDAPTEMVLNWASNIPTDMLTTRFPEQLGSDVTGAIAYFRALQVHHRLPVGSLFITRNGGVLRGRYDGWPHQIGQCTPEEALVLAGLVLRRRNVFLDTLRLSGRVTPHRYNWYCGAAQTLLPSYLSVFADLASEAEKGNAADDLALQYLEGILTRFKSLLRSHDQLGELHLRALRYGTSNDLIEDQGDVFYAATQSAAGILEGIAVLIAELEGTVRPQDRRRVGFSSLVDGTQPWTRSITRYRPVADAAAGALTPLLTLVTNQRIQGYHHFPVTGSAGEFGEVIPIVLSNGTQDVRVIRCLSLPLIRLPKLPDDATWVRSGVDGLILAEKRLYLLPWLALRSATRDLVYLVEQALRALCTVRGVTSGQRETAFLSPEGRDLARRMLDFSNQLHD
jgi:hypothetical protein